jgi:hypothetical protein
LLRHPMSVTTLDPTPPTSTTHSEAPQLWMGATSPPHVSAVQSCSKQGRSSGCSSCSNSTTRMNDARRNRDVASKPVNASWSGSVESVLSQPVACWPTTRQPREGSVTSGKLSSSGLIRVTGCPSSHLHAVARPHTILGDWREHSTQLTTSTHPSNTDYHTSTPASKSLQHPHQRHIQLDASHGGPRCMDLVPVPVPEVWE